MLIKHSKHRGGIEEHARFSKGFTNNKYSKTNLNDFCNFATETLLELKDKRLSIFECCPDFPTRTA